MGLFNFEDAKALKNRLTVENYIPRSLLVFLLAPYGARKNTTQLAKYPRPLYVKASYKECILRCVCDIFVPVICTLRSEV